MSLFDESIQLELNVAELYRIFYDAYPEDSDFWWQLILEENNHAALIKAGRDKFFPKGLFPEEVMAPSLGSVQEINAELSAMLKKYQAIPPSREDAFNIAIYIEESAGEKHFQEFMSKSSGSDIDKLFQKLNSNNKDHAERLYSYMKSHDIVLQELSL